MAKPISPKVVFLDLVPIGSNLVLIGASYRMLQSLFASSILTCYLVAALMLIATIVSLVALTLHETTLRETLRVLSIQSFLLIIGFAAIHLGAGLKGDAEPIDFWDALYFSIVTWTTLGYGDLQPQDGLRVLASLQAVIGYLFLGVVVGLVGAAFNPPKQS